MSTFETRIEQWQPSPPPDLLPGLETAELLLVEAMIKSSAAYGAVVSLKGNSVQIDAATPDVTWLRSVDLFIARALLMRRDIDQEPLLSASNRSYISVGSSSRSAVLILSAS